MIPSLETDRLRLEKLGKHHLSDEYVSWMNDEEVNRYLDTGGDYTMDDLKEFLGSVEADEQLHFWAIVIKEGNKHIGNIKIDPINFRHGFAEYGILVGDRTSWGKGYAREASEVVLDYCFNNLGMRKINLGVVVDNSNAVALYEKIGFKIEGLYKYHDFYMDKYCDSYRMAIFNPEFLKKIDESA